MDRIVRRIGGTVSIVIYDAAGNPIDVPGTTTAAVVDSAARTMTGSPFTCTPGPTGSGILSFPIALSQWVLDTYDVTWNLGDGTKRYSQFALVGSVLFEVADLRAFDPVLADGAKYPSATIVKVREIVEERFERAAGVPFTLRGRRVWLDGSGTSTLMLPDVEVRTVSAIRVNGISLSSGDLANMKIYPHGQLIWDGGTFPPGIRNVEVLYEYGMIAPPEPIRRAGMRYAKHLLVSSPTDDRATAVFTDVGGYRLTLAGRDGPTGLPEVDSVLAEFSRLSVRGFA